MTDFLACMSLTTVRVVLMPKQKQMKTKVDEMDIALGRMTKMIMKKLLLRT